MAGTNGKGSTSAITAAILHAAGRTVGTMPSPHLSSYLERVQVDGEPISEEEFAKGVDWLRARIGGVMQDLGPPTEFEILTSLAITYLARHCYDLVIEVGMGGRLDATNFIGPPGEQANNVQSRGVRPVQVFDDQHGDGALAGLPEQQLANLVGPAAVSKQVAQLAADLLRDVEEGRQRAGRGQRLAGARENGSGLAGAEAADEGCLADPGLTADQHLAT